MQFHIHIPMVALCSLFLHLSYVYKSYLPVLTSIKHAFPPPFCSRLAEYYRVNIQQLPPHAARPLTFSAIFCDT